MPDQLGSDESQFVEVEGVKYKADPNNPEEALKDEQDQPIPFEEEPEETEDQKKAREKKEKEEQEEEDKKEPPVRRSAKDHIIDRKDKKIKKLEKEKEKEDDEDEDEEFTSEGKKLIDKKIAKGLQPILDSVRGQSDMQELKEVLEKYGEPAKKLKKKIEKYMDHPAYKTVPVEFIFLGLASDEIKKAEKKKEADEEAEKDSTGGTQKRPKKIAKIPDVSGMTDKQIGELVHKVRTGQF